MSASERCIEYKAIYKSTGFQLMLLCCGSHTHTHTHTMVKEKRESLACWMCRSGGMAVAAVGSRASVQSADRPSRNSTASTQSLSSRPLWCSSLLTRRRVASPSFRDVIVALSSSSSLPRLLRLRLDGASSRFTAPPTDSSVSLGHHCLLTADDGAGAVVTVSQFIERRRSSHAGQG